MLSMGAKIHKMPEGDLWGGGLPSSSPKTTEIQQETRLGAVLTMLGVISLDPQEIVDDLAKRRENIEALQKSTNNQICNIFQNNNEEAKKVA